MAAEYLNASLGDTYGDSKLLTKHETKPEGKRHKAQQPMDVDTEIE